MAAASLADAAASFTAAASAPASHAARSVPHQRSLLLLRFAVLNLVGFALLAAVWL